MEGKTVITSTIVTLLTSWSAKGSMIMLKLGPKDCRVIYKREIFDSEINFADCIEVADIGL
jgi:hypothetical protein